MYDLFGNGRTALKASFGKYQRAEASAFANQFNPFFSTTESRTWSDTDRAGLALPTNGDNIAQDNEIGPSATSNFGLLRNRSLDPAFNREYNEQVSAGVQHELRTGVAVNFNWYRRMLYNTQSQVNRGVDPATDWTTTAIVNPLNGEPMTVYQLNQNQFGNTSNLYLTTNTDTNRRRNVYTGFELGTSARLPRRTLVFAGWTFERTIDVDCGMNITSVTFFYNDPNSLRFCDQSGEQFQNLGQNAAIPFRHELKINGNVPLWYGFEVSASFQSYAGAVKSVNGGLGWTLTRGSTRYPSDCSVPGCTPGAIVLPSRYAGDPSITVQLVSPGLRYEPRWNQLDFGVRRSFRFGGRTVQAQVDLFNALNANNVLTETTTLGSNVSIAPFLSNDPNTGGVPRSFLQPRIIRLGLQFRF